MSTIHVEKLEGESIFILTYSAEFSLGTDLEESNAKARVLLDAATEPLYGIVDLRQVPPFSIEDIVMAANKNSRGDDPIWQHPMHGEMIFITNSSLMKLVANGQVFGNLDDALTYCRERISASVK